MAKRALRRSIAHPSKPRRVVARALALAATASLAAPAMGAERQGEAISILTLAEQNVRQYYPLPIDPQATRVKVFAAVARRFPDSAAKLRECIDRRQAAADDAAHPLNPVYLAYVCAAPEVSGKDAETGLMTEIIDAYLSALDGENKLIDIPALQSRSKANPAPTIHSLRQADALIVDYPAMGGRSADDFRQALEGPGRDAKLLVIDLRNNAGGAFTEPIRVADIVLKAGKIVSQRGKARSDNLAYYASSDDDDFAGKIAVIVGPGTAEGAEILAAALQDNGRAVVVGQPTQGRGFIRTLMPLDRQQALLLVTSQAVRPAGRPIEGTGVTPDCIADAADPGIVDLAIQVARSGIEGCPPGRDGDKGAPQLQ